MGYLQITCGACGHSWNVYRQTMEYDNSRICPFCGHKMALETYHATVCKAFDTMQKANLELYSDHVNFHHAPFTVDYIEFQEAQPDIAGRLDAIEERLEILATDAVQRAFEAAQEGDTDDE